MRANAAGPAAGSVAAMPRMATTTPNCAASSHARRRPSRADSPGSGSRSTSGAQMNLNEYASAAQLKNVTARRSTPASPSHSDSDEKISNSGNPAEKPSATMAATRQSHNTRHHAGAERGASGRGDAAGGVGMDGTVMDGNEGRGEQRCNRYR